MKKIVRFWGNIALIVCFISCSQELPNKSIVPIKSIERLSDSTYLSDVVSNFVFYNSTIFFSDCSNNRLIRLNSNYDVLKIFGSPGRGPGEFLIPDQFSIVSDSLYVYDHSTKKVLVFGLNGIYTREFKLNAYPEFYSRFAVSNLGKIYVSTPLLDNQITIFDRNGNFLAGIGEKSKEQLTFNEKMTEISHLLIYKNEYLFSIKISRPEIEIYSLEGKFLKKIDLSNLEIFRNLASFFDDNKNHNGSPSIISDVSLYKDQLFLKTASVINGSFFNNTLIRCKLENLEVQPTMSYTLTQKNGDSNMLLFFCMTPRGIIGFNQSNQSIDIYQLITDPVDE